MGAARRTLWGYGRLTIADASIVSTIPNADHQPPAIMVAEHIA
jgi:hypothetical protein